MRVIGAQINCHQELSKRVETYFIPAIDKADLVHKTEEALTTKHNKKSAMKWKDSKTIMHSERTVGVLRNLYSNVVAQTEVVEAWCATSTTWLAQNFSTVM